MKHPYVGLPDRQFWKKEPGIVDPDLLDPVSPPPFQISATDRIVTAGSCFAQHVARVLSQSGFNHHITERAHPLIPADLAAEHNYGLFSARYGNVYTARQLRQLFDRAFGAFVPVVTAWPGPGGEGVVDPFRPQIQPGGFVSEAELDADRAQHFAAIRRAVAEMDVFVFTLGLTEAWEDTRDGAVFPLAPGVAGGVYNPDHVRFRNFTVEETVADLTHVLTWLRGQRPDLNVILTVSPVPLNATYVPRHALVSTILSKAVLRVAAEDVVSRFENCVYFPSYDIITSPHMRGRYFAADCREVLPMGVSHVMDLFLKHFTSQSGERPEVPDLAPNAHTEDMAAKLAVLCDEAAIDNA